MKRTKVHMDDGNDGKSSSASGGVSDKTMVQAVGKGEAAFGVAEQRAVDAKKKTRRERERAGGGYASDSEDDGFAEIDAEDEITASSYILEEW